MRAINILVNVVEQAFGVAMQQIVSCKEAFNEKNFQVNCDFTPSI
jgi:hypothetical protein